MKKAGEPRGVYKALTIERIDLVDRGASFDPATGEGAHVTIVKRADVEKAVLTTASRNKLPNSSFAVVDANGVGHLPYKHADGSIDLPHLRNALARLNQTQLSPADKAKAKAKLEAAARQHLPSSEAAKMAEDYEDSEQDMEEDKKGEAEMKAKKAKAKKIEEPTESEVSKAEERLAVEVKKREALEAMVTKMQDERAREAFVAKAAELPTFGTKDKLGEILHLVSKSLSKEQYEFLVAKMAAASKVISESKLLAELGASESGDESPDAAVAKIATEIRKSNPKLTTEQAYAEALTTPEGRAIYAGWKRAAERGA